MVATHVQQTQSSAWMPLNGTRVREAFTQILLRSILFRGWWLGEDGCDPRVLAMANGTHQCLDLPHSGSPPDGGIDIYDLIHYQKLVANLADPSDILAGSLRLTDCSERVSSSALVPGSRPHVNWLVPCDDIRTTCHCTAPDRSNPDACGSTRRSTTSS